MRQFLYMCVDAAIASVLLIPIFLVLSRGIFRGRAVRYFVLAVYLCGMYAVVGLPNVRYVRLDLNLNLIPLRYLFSNLGNNLLNVLLFIPLGFFLPVLFRRYGKFRRTAAFGFGTSMLIELLQIFTYRATDVNDLITNTLGCALGWGLGTVFLKLFPAVLPCQRTKDLYLVCGIAFLVMFFLHPFLSDLIWGYLL